MEVPRNSKITRIALSIQRKIVDIATPHFEKHGPITSIIAFPIAIILIAFFILVIDSFFWPLRNTVVGKAADKIEQVTGVSIQGEPYNIKYKK